ncbi:hypothetical protein Vadar_012785 [Vaccinium darrowii]|uniref:Uncharacterized protein n=1 Tax=Vaccinium darrowii TaxID=229202 RepID=A0ACB7X946_9ERIC|nr:hypothetical protein Vadar_012785 [Vaccinium darrowii]
MPTWQSLSNLNSPPRLHFPIMDHFVKENMPNLGIPMAMNPNLPTISDDPGFTERAAKFSCFGSRSFNERTSQLSLNSAQLGYGSSALMEEREKTPRVSISPGSSVGARENWNSTQTHMGMRSTSDFDMNLTQIPMSDRAEFPSSNEGSSVSGQFPNGETGLKNPSDFSSKKRKAVSRGKSKVVEAEDDLDTKRCKSTERNRIENDDVKSEKKTDEGQKQEKGSPKPSEPPKDYIHVRARRGQATDSHSLAERVRREKIGERMKLLQDLVPGCNKVTGKALMLDEIINYVQSLQRQVEFLSMKLASVNPNVDSIFSKDVSQPNGSFPPPEAVTQSSVHPLESTYSQNIGSLLAEEFGQGLPQFPTLCEDDLQSIVQMGLGRSPNRDMGLYSQFFPGSSQKSHMKSEF